MPGQGSGRVLSRPSLRADSIEHAIDKLFNTLNFDRHDEENGHQAVLDARELIFGSGTLDGKVILQSLDSNGDGEVDRADFHAFFKKEGSYQGLAQLLGMEYEAEMNKVAFLLAAVNIVHDHLIDVFSEDENGSLNALFDVLNFENNDYKSVLDTRELVLGVGDLSAGVIIARQLDENGDGCVSRKEFLAFFGHGDSSYQALAQVFGCKYTPGDERATFIQQIILIVQANLAEATA